MDLFHDEFRTPAYVSDVCALVLRLVALHGGAEAPSAASTSPFPLTLNVGGPERLSRANMGAAVAALRGHPAAHVRAVAAATVARPCASPVRGWVCACHPPTPPLFAR